MPLNPGFPTDRTRGMLQRSGCRRPWSTSSRVRQLREVLDSMPPGLVLLLPDAEDVSRLASDLPTHVVLGARDLEPSADWTPGPVDPDAIAYLLFTSGGTDNEGIDGRPPLT
ncbi:MAG: hypothetical protein R3E53_07565 [Myxococcota bacterium]